MSYPPDIQVARDLRGRLPDFMLDWQHTALLIVDMQYMDAHPDHGYGLKAKEEGTFKTLEYYFDRLAKVVIPNIAHLAEHFRALSHPVVYVRIGSRRTDGADTSWRYRQFNLLAPPGSKEREILAEIAPKPLDIVIEKTTSGAFNSTNLDQVLRNIQISSLVICGVATNGCVETTVRGAGDLGYMAYLVDDGCAAFKPELHEESIRDMDHNFAIVKSTEEISREMLGDTAVGSHGGQARSK